MDECFTYNFILDQIKIQFFHLHCMIFFLTAKDNTSCYFSREAICLYRSTHTPPKFTLINSFMFAGCWARGFKEGGLGLTI